MATPTLAEYRTVPAGPVMGTVGNVELRIAVEAGTDRERDGTNREVGRIPVESSTAGDQRAPGGYFDAAAAAPLHPVARQALLAGLEEGWAEPSKVYSSGRRARHLLDAARAAVAEALRCRADEVWFTGSGTAACHAAVAGTVRASHAVAEDPGIVVHSAIEHSAVLHAVRAHGGSEGRAVPVPVDRWGRVELDRWRDAVSRPGVVLGALLSASHEVGTTQPVAQAAQACADARVPLFVDAAASLGRMEIPDGWSILAGSAHKWGGPPGVGVLVVRKRVRWMPPAWLSPPGVPQVVAAAAALRAATEEAGAESVRLAALIDRIRETVARTIPDVEVVGDPADRLPHLVTFSCLYVDGEALLHALDQRGFAVSSGSSCTSDTLRPSHVLEAMGVLSHGNVRVSLHREVTEAQVSRFLAELPEIVRDLRAQVGL